MPAGDPEALAAALERLLRDPALRAGMGAAGRARVLAEFGMDRGIDRIAGLLAGEAVPLPDLACASLFTPR